MAVVQDYYSPEGCHIIVHDDCYRDLTPEENRSRRRRAEQIVLRADYVRYLESMRKHENQEI